MSLEGFRPVILKIFGGLCDLIDRLALALGQSPLANNLKFVPGAVASRDGLALYGTLTLGLTGSNGSGQFNPTSLALHTDQDRVNKRLVMDGRGTLFIDWPEGLLTVLDMTFPYAGPTPNILISRTLVRTAQLFGKTYVCFSDGIYPTIAPMQWDGSSVWSRVSRNPPVGYTAVAAAATSATAGTIPIATNYYWFVVGVTSTGYYTRPGAIYAYGPAPGNKAVDLTNIPAFTTSNDIVARRIFFSVPNPPNRGAGPYFSTSQMIIPDATTKTLTALNFSNFDLTSGLSGDDVWNLIPVGPQVGVVAYRNRLVFWGGIRAAWGGLVAGGVPQFTTDRALLFDQDIDSTAFPCGWNLGVAGGGGVYTLGGASGIPSRNLWRVTGDGATATRGSIKVQLSSEDVIGSLDGAKSYAVYLSMRSSTAAGNGTVRVKLRNITSGTDIVNSTFLPSAFVVLNRWQMFLCRPVNPGVAVGKNAQFELTIQVENTPTLNATRDFGEIYVVEYPKWRKTSTLTITQAGAPENIDARSADKDVNLDDGQDVTTCFVLRDACYIVKTDSLWVITDNGQEPSAWPDALVDPIAGTPSPTGVGIGDGFVIICSHAAVYRFDGNTPQNISNEILSTWGSVDWKRGNLIWCHVDAEINKFRIGIPVIGAGDGSGIDVVLECDYREGWGSPIPNGIGRKWTKHTPGYLCGEILRRDDGSHMALFGKGTPNGSNLVPTSEGAGAFTFGASPLWASSGANPTVTDSGQADPWNAFLASKWVIGAGVITYNRPGLAVAPGTNQWVTYSIYLKYNLTTDLPLTLKLSDAIYQGGTPILIATNFGDGQWHRYVLQARTVTSGTPTVTKLSITNSGAAQTVFIFGIQLQTAAWPVDIGYVGTAGAAVTGGVVRGTLATRIEGQHYDFDGPITWNYDTAPIGDEVGRCVFDRTVMRMKGGGTLKTSYVLPDLTTVPLADFDLANTPLNDVELGANVQQTSVCVRLASSGSSDDWFYLRRLVTFIKEAVYGYLRGRGD